MYILKSLYVVATLLLATCVRFDYKEEPQWALGVYQQNDLENILTVGSAPRTSKGLVAQFNAAQNRARDALITKINRSIFQIIYDNMQPNDFKNPELIQLLMNVERNQSNTIKINNLHMMRFYRNPRNMQVYVQMGCNIQAIKLYLKNTKQYQIAQKNKIVKNNENLDKYVTTMLYRAYDVFLSNPLYYMQHSIDAGKLKPIFSHNGVHVNTGGH